MIGNPYSFWKSFRVLGLTGGLALFILSAPESARSQTVSAFDALSYAPKAGSGISLPFVKSKPPEPAPHFYAGAEYLLWWVKGAPLSVPLVSTGPSSPPNGAQPMELSGLRAAWPESPPATEMREDRPSAAL